MSDRRIRPSQTEPVGDLTSSFLDAVDRRLESQSPLDTQGREPAQPPPAYQGPQVPPNSQVLQGSQGRHGSQNNQSSQDTQSSKDLSGLATHATTSNLSVATSNPLKDTGATTPSMADPPKAPLKDTRSNSTTSAAAGPSRGSPAGSGTLLLRTSGSPAPSDVVPVEVAASLARDPIPPSGADDMSINPIPPASAVRPNPTEADPDDLVFLGESSIAARGDGLFTRYGVKQGETIFQEQQILRRNLRSHVGMSDAWLKVPSHDQQILRAEYPILRKLPRSFDSGAYEHADTVRRFLQSHGFEYEGDRIVFRFGSKVNHACPCRPESRVGSQVNARMSPHAFGNGNGILAKFTATRNLEAGDEIFIDYNKLSLKFKCLCSVCEERRSLTWRKKVSMKAGHLRKNVKRAVATAGHRSWQAVRRFGRWASAANWDP